MPSIRRGATLCLGLTLAIALGSCATKPAEELWPNTPIEIGEPWQPELSAVDNLEEWAAVIDVRRAMVGNRQAVMIENLDPDRPITVYYIDNRGSYQVVQIGAGAEQAVAAAPRRIMRVL